MWLRKEKKFKAVTNHKLNVAELMKPDFKRAENNVGKGENAGCQGFFPSVIKTLPCVVKVDILSVK